MKKALSLLFLATALCGDATLLSPEAAFAQQQQQGFRVDKNALEKVRWHQAPREFQIINDDPIVRDFREADAPQGSVVIPSGRAGAAGANGALRQLPASLPPGGLKLGNPEAAFRPAPPGLTSLPKSSFASNIPAKAVAPARALPNGSSTNLLANKQVRARPLSSKPGRPAAAQRHHAGSSAPAVLSYDSGYAGGGKTSSGLKVETSVQAKVRPGSLLSK